LERKRKKGAKERDLVQGCRTYSDNRKTEYKDSTLKSDLMRSERERQGKELQPILSQRQEISEQYEVQRILRGKCRKRKKD